mmetsp:Transcript_26336/g.36959  ORF Transcript_26336/g.36959 Transcript_26336/m.36959 type:complete len:205 (+) Transcript_26336:91-705(+)
MFCYLLAGVLVAILDLQQHGGIILRRRHGRRRRQLLVIFQGLQQHLVECRLCFVDLCELMKLADARDTFRQVLSHLSGGSKGAHSLLQGILGHPGTGKDFFRLTNGSLGQRLTTNGLLGTFATFVQKFLPFLVGAHTLLRGFVALLRMLLYQGQTLIETSLHLILPALSLQTHVLLLLRQGHWRLFESGGFVRVGGRCRSMQLS